MKILGFKENYLEIFSCLKYYSNGYFYYLNVVLINNVRKFMIF